MFYMSAFNDEYLDPYIDRSEHSVKLKSALKKFNDSDSQAGHQICKSLKYKCDVATVLSSLFSYETETFSEFQIRHISELEAAATLDNPFAQYSLGVYHDVGDLVDLDIQKSTSYWRRSAESKFPLACHTYGIALFYGTEYVDRDRERGLAMLKFAADSGVEDTVDFLKSELFSKALKKWEQEQEQEQEQGLKI